MAFTATQIHNQKSALTILQLLFACHKSVFFQNFYMQKMYQFYFQNKKGNKIV